MSQSFEASASQEEAQQNAMSPELKAYLKAEETNSNTNGDRYEALPEDKQSQFVQNDTVCPVTKSLINTPVKVGPHYFEYSAIKTLLENTINGIAENPLTREPFSIRDVKPAPEKQIEIKALLSEIENEATVSQENSLRI